MTPPPHLLVVEHNAPLRYRPDIDGLRAIAILSVLFYHAAPTWVTGGFVGVDVFFVISGYLIASIIFRSLAKNDFSFTEFYVHRTLRIFPPLVLMLISCFVLGWFFLLPDEFKLLGKHMAASAGFVENFNLWLEAGYFDAETAQKPLMHLWSLAIEEQYYLLFPAFAWAAWRLPLRTLIIGICGVSFSINIAGAYYFDAKLAFLSPVARFWELLTGGLLALSALSPKLSASQQMFGRWASPLGLVFILLSLSLLDQTVAYPGWPALLPVTGAALLLMGSEKSWVNRHLLANKPMIFIGKISYPLYLWHWPLLALPFVITGEEPGSAFVAGALALSFLCATLSYFLIEKPVRFGKSYRQAKALAFVVLMAIVGYVGYNVYQRNGLEFRVKTILGNNTQFHFRDVPDSYLFLNNCLNRFPKFSGGCLQSHNRPPNVALLGDSHSLNLFHGLADLTRDDQQINVLNLRRDSALLLRGVGTFGRDTEARNQKEFQETSSIATQAMEILAKTESIQTVIILLRGSDYFDDGRKTIRLPGRSELAENRTVWLTALKETIEYITRINKKLIIVMDWPQLDFDPKICINARTTPENSGQPRCSMSKAVVEQSAADFRKLTASVLANNPTVVVFDSSSYFCNDKVCFAKQNGEILYSDQGHLSLQGARHLGGYLLPLIRASLD